MSQALYKKVIDLVWNSEKQTTKMFISVKGIPALIIST